MTKLKLHDVIFLSNLSRVLPRCVIEDIHKRIFTNQSPSHVASPVFFEVTTISSSIMQCGQVMLQTHHPVHQNIPNNYLENWHN